MILTLDLVDDDFAGEDPVALFFEVQSDVEIAEVVLVEGIVVDAQIQGFSIALIALEQSFPQRGFDNLRRQFLLLTDVINEVAETGKKDECHQEMWVMRDVEERGWLSCWER